MPSILACAFALLPLLTPPPPPDPARLLAGERMYRQAVLPSGEPMRAAAGPAPGVAFACAGCHLRAGFGSTGESQVTPGITGPHLFRPRYRTQRRLTGAERASLGPHGQPWRPAYTEASLARAIRTGEDPAGHRLSTAMPRYDLDDQAMGILVDYLKTLSERPSPGVDGTDLRFATVIDAQVRPQDRNAMLRPLLGFMDLHNRLPGGFGQRLYRTPVRQELVQDFRRLSLAQWVLTGPASTWRRQLQEHYRREPVFALLGGITYGSWKPVHDFCEDLRLPCLLPVTDFPDASGTGEYTVYFTRGYRLEADAAARFLDSRGAARVLQVVQGQAGRELAAGFEAAWTELGRPRPVTLALAEGPGPEPGWLDRALRREHPDAVLVWTGPDPLAHAGAAPAVPLVVSGGALKERLDALPERLRPHTFITYPYRLARDEARVRSRTVASLAQPSGPGDRIGSRMYSLVQILTQAFMELDGAYLRDALLDRLDLLPDQVLPDYPRLSFGAGRRFLGEDCSIVQLAPGPGLELTVVPGP